MTSEQGSDESEAVRSHVGNTPGQREGQTLRQEQATQRDTALQLSPDSVSYTASNLTASDPNSAVPNTSTLLAQIPAHL